ncbi:Amidase [Raoultella terrigena]|uniref:Amidase n=1 Tax=Raoultella terrigena TaxID=577 RepID=A0A4U9CVC1_RAOTE|nr:Amidase [Raoultella terrigena]
MAIQRPTAEQLQELASRLHISLTPAQSEEYLALMQANFDAYDLVDSLPDEIPEVRYPTRRWLSPDWRGKSAQRVVLQNRGERCDDWRAGRIYHRS